MVIISFILEKEIEILELDKVIKRDAKMKINKYIIAVYSIILLLNSLYAVGSSIYAFANNAESKELFSLLNGSALFIAVVLLSYFVFYNNKLNIKFLILPCGFLMLNILINIARKIALMPGSIGLFTFAFDCYGVLSLIILALDLHNGLVRSQVGIKLLFSFWIIGAVLSVVINLGVVGGGFFILLNLLPVIFSPIFLLIVILRYHLKAEALVENNYNRPE